ncbi:30S ribosomal protein S12 methylthiotransferase RimO [bacterium]|nr:30S ribosomal protein S12 methylthiotransferase RimO [bacterium]
MTTPVRIGLISLGCAKNLVDSELMLGALARDGMELTTDLRDADVVIVNTCGFIEPAKQESIDTILRANQLRRHGRCRALVVAGCLAQRYPRDLARDLPEVDAFVGLNEVPRIGAILREVLARRNAPADHRQSPARRRRAASSRLYWSGPARYVPEVSAPRLRLTPPHYAYVKIAEGCNHPCSFCSIPRIRGRHRSRSRSDIVAEVRALVASGVREINLISQDTTFYGRDLAGGERTSLAALLRALQRVPGRFWVRLLYTHPAHWDDELIHAIADCDNVCRYVDLPLQHINDAILTRMRRETDGRSIRDLLGRIRSGLPGVAVRTTFIVGFPGETEAQFGELLAFLKEARFERAGVFAYSAEDHTPAGTMPHQVSARVAQRRRRQAMTVQQQVSRQVLRGWVGRQFPVLVEGRHRRGWLGRSHLDAPDIDGRVYLRGKATVGEFVPVRITSAAVYDLRGEVVKTPRAI